MGFSHAAGAVLYALALAACGQSQPASRPPTVPEPSPAIEPDQDLLTRWRMILVPGRPAAEYSKSETDAVWYRMECRGDVVVVTELRASLDYDGTAPWPKGGGFYDLVLRERGGRQLSASTSGAEVVRGDLVMRFRLPGGTFDIVDSRPNLELGLKNNATGQVGWTRLNDVARDVLMACTGG